MLSQRSLKERFTIEIAVSMTAILLLVIIVLSTYFSTTLIGNIKDEMREHSKFIIATYPTQSDYNQHNHSNTFKTLSNYEILILKDSEYTHKEIINYKTNEKNYLRLTEHYPSSGKYLQLTKEVTAQYDLIKKMYYVIVGIIIFGMLFIPFMAHILAKKILQPVHLLTQKFTKMDEHLLEYINTDNLPFEFIRLSDSINQLITKIKTFINYRKELFIGTAHELKTPLAVMRLKNQITLMKYKKQDVIKETLAQNLESIDNLNAMIHNILEYGRAEGAQFEQPQRINLIRLMANKCEEYELLANSQNRNFIYHFNVPHFSIHLQELLFMQIFQNFIQNALRFTKENGLVSLQTRTDTENFIIEIIDEGPGIDTSKNLFAPFKRSIESTGAGLGLFLAQNAAESMGVDISLKNRQNTSGAIASIVFPLNKFLLKN